MELLQLKYFRAVADAGKISTAARNLYISPPALSAAISRLEKDLGCELFDRSNNSIVLNRNGEIFRKYVDQVFRSLDDARAELAQATDPDRRHIRIGVTTSNLWIGLICAFSLEFPQITLSYTTQKLSQLDGRFGQKYRLLIAEDRDFDGSRLNSSLLFDDDRPVLMVPPDHPLAGRESVDLRTCGDENFILPTADQSLHQIAVSLLDEAGIRVKHPFECTYMLRRSAVANHQGISFSTAYACRNEDPALRYIPIDTPVCKLTQRVYWERGTHLRPEEELFLRFARDYFK